MVRTTRQKRLMGGPIDSVITWAPTLNVSRVIGPRDVLATVIHYTAGSAYTGSVRWLQMKESRASAHFVIGRRGQIVQLANCNDIAWHAGRSEIEIAGTIHEDVNSLSVGIELANHGLLQCADGDCFYQLGRTLHSYRRADPQFAIHPGPGG